MKNRKLHEERMRSYFLQATKELLKAEGLKSISVRSIAEKAGYSYTTMYSYFEDVQDLIFLCVHDFYAECRDYVQERVKKGTAKGSSRRKGEHQLKELVRAYADFFIQYPGIFDLFFLEKTGDLGNRKATAELICYSLDRVCGEEWDYCTSHGLFAPEKVEGIKGELRNMVYGSLLLYLNRRMPASYTAFAQALQQQTDAILDTGRDGTKAIAGPAKGSGESLSAGGKSVTNAIISIKVGNNK